MAADDIIKRYANQMLARCFQVCVVRGDERQGFTLPNKPARKSRDHADGKAH